MLQLNVTALRAVRACSASRSVCWGGISGKMQVQAHMLFDWCHANTLGWNCCDGMEAVICIYSELVSHTTKKFERCWQPLH